MRRQRDTTGASQAAGPAVEQPAAAPTGAAPFPDASAAARQLAAAILEVLAGVQTPAEAARTLGLSQARYYQVEMRALAGLVSACEDRRRKGRGRAAGSDLAALRRECEQLRRECARQQALARATRRTVGLAPAPPPPPAESGVKRRPRRPTARALKMAALLRTADDDQTEPPAVADPVAAAPPVTSPAPL